MNRGLPSVFHDQELVEMLINDPELLAMADALATAKRDGRDVVTNSKRSSRKRFATAAGLGAAAAATVALLAASPWQGAPSLVQKALAAVGDGPVLHVVVAQRALYGGPLVDIRTEETIEQTQQTEIWFDADRNLKKTIETLDGIVLDEELQTDQGGWNQGGRIITCEWIAEHPDEATRLRVSCDTSGDNGRVPRSVPERPPTLDPALAGFVDHYRSALASGAAKKVGAGEYRGHDAFWLAFAANGRTELVAVDAHSYKPLALEEQGGELTLRVLEATAIPYNSRFFTKPSPVEAQRGSTVIAESQVTPGAAAAALGGRSLWLGPSWNGLKLVATSRQERTIGYGPAREPGHAEVIRFTYVPTTTEGTADVHSRVDIYESTTCVLSIGWECNARDPATPGQFKHFGPISLVRREGLYVSVWNVSSSEQALGLARALVRITPSSR